MGKKIKRQMRSVAPSESRVGTASTGYRPLREEFNPDYSHVVKDLRRIGILAGSFIVSLIALSFLLPIFLK
jgi:hypothetical protein